MAVNLQEQFEQAVYNLIEPVDFSPYDPALRQWREGSKGLTYPAVVIQVGQVNEGPISGELWDIQLSVISLTYAPDDEDQTALNDIHDKIFRRVNNISLADLEAELDNITVQGIFLDGTSAAADDNEQRESVDIRINCHASLADVSTTSTTTTTTT
jgi:hypothetical protein